MRGLTSTERDAMMEVPEAFLERLEAVARKVLGPRDATGEALAQRVARLSELYTRRREELASVPTAQTLAARLRFFLPRDLPKVTGPLSELAAAGALPEGRDGRWRVLDLGAGCGATTFGAALFARRLGAAEGLDVVAIDRDALALRCLAEIASEGERAGLLPMKVETRPADVGSAPEGPFDLILLGLVLNELGEDPEAKARLLSDLSRRLTDDGALIVIEPALRETSRELHAVRDLLVASPRGPHLFAPCLRGGGCPMLQTDRDWCHEDLPTSLPPSLVATARSAGLRYERLTYSYLTLRRDDRTLRSVTEGCGGEPYRVVSHPRPTKGKVELFGCGAPGRVRVARLTRHRSGDNAALDGARRGDLLCISSDHPDERGRLRVRPGDSVRKPG